MEFTKASWPVGLHMSASSKEELTHHFPPLDPNVPWTSPIATIFNTMIPKLNTLSILFGLSKTEEDSEGMTSTKPVPVLLEDCINKPGFKEHLTHLESFVHYIDHVRSYMLVHPSEYKQLKTDKVEFISQSNEEEFKTFIQDLYSFFEITNADKLYKSPSSDSSKLDTVIRNLLNVDMSKIDKSILPIKIQENFKNLSLTSNKSTFDCYCAFEVMQPSTLEEYTSIRSKKEARPDIFSLDYLKTKNIMEDSQLWELAKIVLSPPPKAPAQKRTREGDQPEDESKPKKAATAKTKVKQPSKTKRESDDETKEPETKRPREEELPPTEPMEKDDEELLPAVDFDDARIGSSLAYNVSKVAVSRQRDHLHFYRMYYVLTSVYYYCTDMLNMFILAQEIHYNAFLKKKLVEFSHVRLYYYAHTLGFLLRNANVAETKSADQKMIPSRSMFAVLLTGESEESMPANYFNYLIPQDQRILKTESFVTPNIISHGLYDHIWKNLTMDARHYKPLFIPWMVGAFFNRVEDRQAELMTTELTKVTYPLVIRSNFPIYRFHLSYIYKQWIKVLGLSDLNQAKETMTTSDYNEAQLILLRSLPLLNKGVLLEKVYNTSGKMDYLYKILASANASKKSSKKMPSVPKEEDEEDNPEEFINASVLDSIDSTLWLNDKFLDFVTEGGQVSKLEMGTAKIVAPRFILLDGHVFRQPRTQLEWMQLAQGDSLRTLMFMNLKDTSLVLYLKKISGVNLEQVNKLFQNKSVFVIQHSDLDNIPRTFNNDEDLFTNISRIIIDRPLPPNGHEAHIYISDKKVKNETELITIQLNNLTRASRDPLTFEPMQKIHFHATISERRTLIFDFSKALFGIETMPIDQVEKAMADFMTASFSATVEGNKKKLILKPLFKPFELENCIPCKMPTSFDVDDISDPINGISRWWWNAHLWNEAYSLTLTHDEEQLIITDMDDLREVNIKKNLLEPLPYLGPYLVDCPNVLAQFDDLKEDIMQGRSLLGYKKRDTFNFSLTWSEPNNFTKDDVERLNDYKFYRIGSHLMNWITDPTTMLIHTFRDPELVNKKTYLPSTITNGLAPIAFSYNADRTAMTQLEYLKGSHLEARTQVNPAKQTNDGVLFTLRNLEISNTQASKEPHHWMANLCKIKEPKIWSDLGMSVINKHHYGDLNNDINQPSDFAHVFFGFTGLALLFSKNHINMDKSLIDREKDKAYFTAEQRRDIQEAKAAGKETIEITRLVLKGSHTNDKDAKFEVKKTEEKVDDLLDEMAFRDKPNNDFTESKPIHATVMLLDLFDTDRLDRRGVKLYHEMLPNEVGYPLNRHAVYYSDSILRQSDIIVPDIVPSNFGVKSSAIKESDVLMSSTPTGLQTADKRILLMTIWEDNETDYVMHVSMDAIFMLLAIKTLQTPVSPYEFFKTFQSKADTVKTETNRFNPVIKYPELGNIHNYNDMENESFKFPIAEQVEGQPIILETKSDHIPLGMVPSVYSEFKEPLRELETLFTPNETFDLFNGIYQTIQKAQKDLQDKIELAKQTRPSYEDGTLMSDPEIITDLTLKEDAIFMGYSLIDADFHNKFLYSDISMGQWWRPRCNTNMLKHPIFMVDEAYRNEKIFVTNSQGEKEPTIVTKVVKGNQSVEHLLKQLEPDMHDIPLLSNTWAFLPDLEEFKKSATLPKDVDDLKKIDLPPDVIPRSEYADRSRANDNFNLVIEQSMFNAACDFYEGGIYSNLCVMAMFMLTKRFPLDSTSLCKKLTTWFCTKFAPFSLAYQIPNDLFEPAMYRTYDEKENLARRQKLGKEKEIKPQNIALNINEENAPIYVNEDLMFDLKQHKTLWLYYYSTIIGPEATTKLLKSLKIKENTEDEEETKHTKKPQQETGEDENIENLTEDDDKDKDTIEELNENDYVKIFENYKSYSDGDVRAKTIRWPWASKEKAANDVKETDANELQKLNSDPLYNKHSKNGVSELVITMNGPDTAVFEEIRLFRGINLSEEMNNILRKNNNQGDVYYYRNYPFIPFLNQEAKSFTRNVIYPSKTLEIIEPFLFINTDEQTLYEIQKYNASPLPEPRVYDLAGDVKQYITITDVTNMMDVDEPTPPVVEPKEEEQVPVKPKEDMMDIVKPEEKPKQEEIPVVKPQDTMDIVKPKQEIPNNLLTLLDTYQKRMENVFKDDLPVFTNFFTWLQKIVEQFQSTTMVAIFNMVKQRGGLLNETAPSKLYTSLQKLGIWVNNSTIVAELRQEFITHYSLDWTTYLNDLKTHWHLIVHETVSQFNPTIYTFLSKKLMTMASHLYLILSVCYDDVNTLQATILDNPDATEQELDMAGIIDEELPFLDSVFELFNTGSMTIYKFIPMISEEMVAKSWPVELEEDKGKRDRERKRQELLAKRQARTTNQ